MSNTTCIFYFFRFCDGGEILFGQMTKNSVYLAKNLRVNSVLFALVTVARSDSAK